MHESTARAGRGSFRARVRAALYDRYTARIDARVGLDRRAPLVQSARGRVLEVGAGTGLTLRHYPSREDLSLVLLDPDAAMLDRARKRAAALGLAVELRLGSAERLDFPDASFDTVVFSEALCTIPRPDRALDEARRVLRSRGRLLLFEHVRSHDPRLAAWQDRLAGLQGVWTGGCRPNQDTAELVRRSGFEFLSLTEGYAARHPNPLVRPYIIGEAEPASAG